MKKDSPPRNDVTLTEVMGNPDQKLAQIMCEIPALIVASGSNTDYAIDESLAKVGQLFDASRVYVMLDEKDGKYLRNTHEWVDEKVGHAMFSWPLYDYEYDLPALKSLLEEKQIIYGTPETVTDDLKIIMTKQRIRSLFVAPLLRDGNKIGLVGIDFCEKEYPQTREAALVLTFLSSMVAFALERKQYQVMRSKLHAIRGCIADVEPILACHKNDEKAEVRPAKPITLLEAERRLIIETMELYHGNKLKTAKHLGLTWPSLDRRCKKLGIESRRK